MKQVSKSQTLPKLDAAEFPAALYSDFEYELGQIDIHVCAADTALQDFAEKTRAHPIALNESLKRYGHGRINASELSIDVTLDLSYASHIALLLSRLEQHCWRIRHHKWVNSKLGERAQGDYLRKTLWVILASQLSKEPGTPLELKIVEGSLGKEEVRRFDEFRTLRNDRLHPSEPESTGTPPDTGALRFPDVLQCSKTLQALARGLCRALVGPPHRLVPLLEQRFGSLLGDRRRFGAIEALTQSYLLDEQEASAILSELAW